MGGGNTKKAKQYQKSEKTSQDPASSSNNVEHDEATDKASITPKSRLRRGTTNKPKTGKELRRRRLSLVTHEGDAEHTNSAARAVADVATMRRQESFSDTELNSPGSPSPEQSLTFKGASGFEGQQPAEGRQCRHLPYSFGTYSRPGNDPMKNRKENQDCFIVEDRWGGHKSQYLACVFDGHGPNGHLVSNFCRDVWPAIALAEMA
jgi:hypothetical protein